MLLSLTEDGILNIEYWILIYQFDSTSRPYSIAANGTNRECGYVAQSKSKSKSKLLALGSKRL